MVTKTRESEKPEGDESGNHTKKTMGKETKLGKINIYTNTERQVRQRKERGRQRKVTRVKKMTSNEQVEHGPELERK